MLIAAYLLASLTSLARWDRRLSARTACRSGGVGGADYDTPLHVGALFLIWLVSTLACAFPIMAARLPWLRIPRRFFFAVRHFGTGILIATAFVHLLPTAFVSLGNPCLGDFWTKDYEAMPGAISLAAIFLVTVVEMALHSSRRIPPPLPAAPGPVFGDGHAALPRRAAARPGVERRPGAGAAGRRRKQHRRQRRQQQ